MERVTIVATTVGSYHEESHKLLLDGKKIGFIFRVGKVQPSPYCIARGYTPSSLTLRSPSDYCFSALRHPKEPYEHFDAHKFDGYADTLAGAHNLAQAYANYLIKRGF